MTPFNFPEPDPSSATAAFFADLLAAERTHGNKLASEVIDLIVVDEAQVAAIIDEGHEDALALISGSRFCTGEHLARLLRGTPMVRCFALRNGMLRDEQILKVVHSGRSADIRDLARNDRLSFDMAQTIAEHPDGDVVAAIVPVLVKIGCPIGSLANDARSAVRLAVAEISTDSALLKVLIQDSERRVRIAAAVNGSVDPACVGALIPDLVAEGDEDGLEAVMRRHSDRFDSDTLADLAAFEFRSWGLRTMVYTHPRTPYWARAMMD